MKKSDMTSGPTYYDRYTSLVPDVEMSQALDDSIQQLNDLDRNLLNRIGDKTYAPGKWTIKDILQHMIDGERIMTYRALMFARRDPTAPGFDQEDFARNANANRRTTDALLDELISVRRTTKLLYESFDDDMLRARGMSWEYEIGVLDLAFIIVGHQLHHLNVISERYAKLGDSM